MKLEVEENGGVITIAAQSAAGDRSYSATLARSESGFGVSGVGDGAMSALPELFRGSSVGVDIYFGGDFAFRV